VRAVRVGGPGEVTLAELPEPVGRPDEVTVRSAVVGVCATDRRLVARGADPPRVPGHEVVGYLPDGTVVGVHPNIGCGACPTCRSGWDNRCPTGVSIGLGRDGGLAELLSVPARHVVPLAGLEVTHGAFLEPLACCLHAVDQLGVRPGERALVVGAGPMGVLAMWALQAAGATVAVAQRSPARRGLATRLGADAVVGSGEDPAPALGGSPTVAVVSAPGSRSLDDAVRTVAVGGRVHVFAGTSGGARVDANVVHYRHLTVMGSTGSRLSDYRRAVALAGAGEIDLSRLPRTIEYLDDAPEHLRQPPDDAFKVLVRTGPDPEEVG
jgi:L-iditol 2-dehydrogenase